MLNKNKFRGAVAAAGLTQKRLAELMGITENTLSAKVNGRRCFDTCEIDQICAILNIDNPTEKALIFLCDSSHFRDEYKQKSRPA